MLKSWLSGVIFLRGVGRWVLLNGRSAWSRWGLLVIASCLLRTCMWCLSLVFICSDVSQSCVSLEDHYHYLGWDQCTTIFTIFIFRVPLFPLFFTTFHYFQYPQTVVQLQSSKVCSTRENVKLCTHKKPKYSTTMFVHFHTIFIKHGPRPLGSIGQSKVQHARWPWWRLYGNVRTL